MGRRILVTGSQGFVGQHLTAAIARDLPDAAVIEGTCDVTDAAAVAAEIGAASPTNCVHLAAVSAIPAASGDPGHAWRVNLHGTLNVAAALMAHARDCQMLYASSADAYGVSFSAGTALDETAPLAPSNVYAATKAAADLALGALAAQGLEVVRLRLFSHTGPGQSPAFVVAAFAEQVARIAAGLTPPVVRVGALDVRRDILDVRDVCAACIACIVRRERIGSGAVYNIASGRARRVRDILDALLSLGGVEAAVETSPARLRRSDVAQTLGDSARAQRDLDWRPTTTWEATLADVLADWRQRTRARHDVSAPTGP